MLRQIQISQSKLLIFKYLPISVEWRTYDTNRKQLFWWKQEKTLSFEKVWKVLIEKIEILIVKNISPLNFVKVIQKYKRTRMSLIIGTDFSKFGVYSKSVTKSLYEKFLLSDDIFKLICHCEKWRWSNISCA